MPNAETEQTYGRWYDGIRKVMVADANASGIRIIMESE
jgi:hypothetical protein